MFVIASERPAIRRVWSPARGGENWSSSLRKTV
jgi:hypothetical protein